VTVPNLTRSESTSIESTRLDLRTVTGFTDGHVTAGLARYSMSAKLDILSIEASVLTSWGD
jgi:hypothetical protein